MKKIFTLISISLLFLGCDGKKATFLENVQSENSHKASVLKLQNTIKTLGLTIFETIDHQANAKTVNMRLKPETVVVFGNPKMGTVLMDCNPSMGLELPLRILVTTNYEGTTSFIYTNPEYWSLKHNIKDKNCLGILNRAKLALGDIVEKASKK